MHNLSVRLGSALFFAVCLLFNANAADNSKQAPGIYLASPFGFSEAGRNFQYEKLIPTLHSLGFEIIDPWKLIDQSKIRHVAEMPLGEERKEAWAKLDGEIGRENQAALTACQFVVAILDGVDVDSGTAAEIGYAFALGKPVIGYRGDFRLTGDNEGAVVNLQVEYFIRASGGTIVHSTDALVEVLRRQVVISDTLPKRMEIGIETQSEALHPSDDYLDVIKVITTVFGIVLALALGESFKQFVADGNTVKTHWDRLPALLSFLVIICPFFQGINRYFFLAYRVPGEIENPYAMRLAFDGVIFLIEAAIFFGMSRRLSPEQSTNFYKGVLGLLGVDTIWGLVSHFFYGSPTMNWVKLNILSMGVLAILLLSLRKKAVGVGVAAFLCALMFIRSYLDYRQNWSFYFPSIH